MEFASFYLVTFYLLILVFFSGPILINSAPIGAQFLGEDHNNNLNVSIQVDGPNSLSGQLRIVLNGSSHHLVNVSKLWPIFSHALPHNQQLDINNQSSKYFAVIGIHTYQRNVTFCERIGSGQYQSLLNGTNLGLVWKVADLEPLCLYNAHSTPLNVLLLLNLYDNAHPVPGGCNIEFALENSPFIFVHRKPSFISGGPLFDYVEFQPAALGSSAVPSSRQCGQLSRARLSYEVYAHYGQDGKDGAEEEYFQEINLMSNRRWLQKHATLIHRISHHFHAHSSSALAALTSSSTDSPFLRLFVITSLNQQIYFNIVAIDDDDDQLGNDNHNDRHGQHFNSSTVQSETWKSSRVVSSHHHHRIASLYVPSQITSHVSLSNYAQLFISLSALSLFSLVVSIIGYRHFILELFYFTFLLTLGLLLCVGSRVASTTGHPGSITFWLLSGSTLASLVISAAWTELCRRTRNLKCAFCGHSLTLAVATVAITGDVLISLPVTSTLLLAGGPGGSGAHYLYYLAVLSILLCHGLFLLYLDYFWLSALSSSFATVYFLLLPLDLYLFSGILFRILFQLYLVLTAFSANSSTATTTVTFINFSSRDVFLLVLFTLLVSGSVYWQLISKLASKGYGFGCMAPAAKISSVSSIVANLKLQVHQPIASKIDHQEKNIIKLKKPDETNSNGTKNQSPKSKPRRRSRTLASLNCRKSRSKSNSPTSRNVQKKKLYRCKHCQKYSTTRCTSGTSTRKLRNSCSKLRPSQSRNGHHHHQHNYDQ